MALSNGLSLYAVFPDLGTYDPAHPNYYPIETGAVFTDDYNETLDTGTIAIRNVPESDAGGIADISVYDTVLVYSLIGTTYTLLKRMLVDKFTDNRTRATAPFYHTYVIYLFSETKALEGITLPNMSFTKRPTNGSYYVYTVFDHIAELLQQYSPRKRVGTSSSWSWVQVFGIDTSQDLVGKFNNECPDMQWNKPTLREVLNDLMLTQYCLPKLSNGKLGYLDLEQKNGELTADQLHCIDVYQKSQDSSEWASDLSLTVDNVTNNEQANIDNTINVCEMVSFKNNDDYVLKSPNNIRVNTSYPIYSDPKVTMCFIACVFDSGTSAYTNYYFEFDISACISEYQKHITKPMFYGQDPSSLSWNSGDNRFTSYQNLCPFYHRGSSYIEGFSQWNGWVTWGSVVQDYEIGLLYTAAAKQCGIRTGELTYPSYDSGGTVFGLLDCVFFKIEYQTLASDKALVGKTLPQKHHFEVFDKQASSYSDSQKLGLFEYSKANRVGNKVRLLNGRFTDYSIIPTLSQTYDGATCFERTITYDKNCFIATMKFTEDYVLQDYFNSVRAKIRSWQISSDSDALERHDLFKVFCEFSKRQKKDSLDMTDSAGFTKFKTNMVAESFCESLIHNPIPETVNGSFVTTENGSDYYPSQYGGYALDTQAEIFGDSLKFTFGFLDNYKVCNYIVGDNNGNIGGWPQSPYSYVDGKTGESTAGTAYFYSEAPIGKDTSYNWPSVLEVVNDKNKFLWVRSSAWQKPLLNSTDAYYYVSWTLHKDNRDITKITTQFEFCVDTKDIVFGKKYLERQKAVSTLSEMVASSPNGGAFGSLATLERVDSSRSSTYKVFDLPLDASDSANQGKFVLSYGSTLYQSQYLHAGKGVASDGWYWIQITDQAYIGYYYTYNGDYYFFYKGSWKRLGANARFRIYGFDSPEFDGSLKEQPIPSGGHLIDEMDSHGTSIIKIESGVSWQTSAHIYLNYPSSYKAIAICDSSDSIILAWNGSATDGIWLNLLLSRDVNIYSSTNGDEKVGTIVV